MKPRVKIAHARTEVTKEGTQLVILTLACGHTTRRTVRKSQVSGGAVKFGCSRLPCRTCAPV